MRRPPISEELAHEIEQRLARSRRYQQLTKRIRRKSNQLTRLLDDKTKQLLLQLEEDLNARCALESIIHHDLGVEEGQAKSLLQRREKPSVTLRVLAAATEMEREAD